MKHFHTTSPFLRVKVTMLGWAVSGKCYAELVGLCSEMPVGDVRFLPDCNSMLEEPGSRGASRDEVEAILEKMQQPA